MPCPAISFTSSQESGSHARGGDVSLSFGTVSSERWGKYVFVPINPAVTKNVAGSRFHRRMG